MLEYRLPDETTILASGHDPVPKGAVLLRMRLVPLSRQTRLAFREYINLLAAPLEKQDRWGGDVVE